MKLIKYLIVIGIMTGVGVYGWLISYNSMPQSVPEPEESVIILKLGHDMPVGSAQHMSALRFADIVNYKTRGKVRIEVYPNQELGTDQQMVEMVRNGTLAMALPPTAKMTTLIPELQVLDLPFLFKSRQDLYSILDGELGRLLLDKMKPYGLVGVTFWESGFKQFINNKPVTHPDDFQNMNIRVMKSPMIMDQFKLFQANPVPIDFHKTYKAIEDKVVDGLENPITSIYMLKFHKRLRHMTISHHAYLAHAFVMSQKKLDTLSPEIQDILYSTALELTPFERKEVITAEKDFLKKLQQDGVRIYHLSDQEKDAFKNKTKSLYENFRTFGGDLLENIEVVLSKKYNAIRNEIVIGLNADLVAGSSLAGQSILRGMELAVNEINQNGGVLGKKLKIIAKDNSGISARGIDNMVYFSEVENLAAVFCGIYSPIALAELEMVHQHKILFLNPWAAATRIVDNGYQPNFVFRVSVRDEYAAPFLVIEALKNYKKVALLLVNDGWGKGNYKGMIDNLALRGTKPVAVEWFNWGQKDMTSQLERIEKSGADVILMVAGAIEGATIIKNISARSIKIPVISHWGITGGHFWKAVNRELENVSVSFLQSFSFMGKQNEKTKQLVQNYFKTYRINHPGKSLHRLEQPMRMIWFICWQWR